MLLPEKDRLSGLRERTGDSETQRSSSMQLETFLLFAPACFAINMAFGPNNLLSLTNGARTGIAPTSGTMMVGFGLALMFTRRPSS